MNRFQAALEDLSDETIMTHGFAPYNRDFIMEVYISSGLVHTRARQRDR